MNAKLFIVLLFFLSSFISIFSQKAIDPERVSFICSENEGFYKDIFMDGGVKLTSLKRLPAADLLNLSLELLTTSRYASTFPPTKQDTIIQESLIIGNDEDINGILLYPDGAPRFRMIYMNGGKSAGHGKSLGEIGKERIREFVNNGGSYVGSCAGAFFSSLGVHTEDSIRNSKYYLGIWPGLTRGTGITKSYTGLFVEKDSPLLKYYDFGKNMYIDSVRHNGGCYAYAESKGFDSTEVLTRYDCKKNKKVHNEVNAWAYKRDEVSGRIVVTGSHPESVTKGKRLEFMASMVLYALEGVAKPKIKGNLQNGKQRKMYKSTYDNIPDYTMIGDKQYHHFTVDIPPKAKKIHVTLEGAKGYDLFLFMSKDSFAFKGNSIYSDISLGSEKTFTLNDLEAGTWYISVLCNTTVETVKTDWGYKYVGKTEVLNGVPYHIVVKWE